MGGDSEPLPRVEQPIIAIYRQLFLVPLLLVHASAKADLVVAENGKNKAEALASVAKGNETVEWACSMPQLMQVISCAVAGHEGVGSGSGG